MAYGISKDVPQVLHDLHLNLVSSSDVVLWWKQKLIWKWQNSRLRESSWEIDVQKKKKKTVVTVAPNPSGPQQYGVTNYRPDRPASEDSTSLERHVSTLRLEIRKKKHDQDIAKVCIFPNY